MANEIASQQNIQTGEIILYQPDETVRLEVRLEDDTVWLTQAQMAELFQTTKNNITIHIGNVYKEKELLPQPTSKESLLVRMEGHRQVTREVKLYNLDVIISVGYRVKSQRGTEFRQWANKVIKDYLLRGYAINYQVRQLADKVEAQQGKIEQIESTLLNHQEKIDFFVRTNQPPVEGIFYDGQIFDAYRFVNDLIRKAKNRVVLIDNYVDDTVLAMLDKRADGVSATIYTQHVSQQLQLDIDRHNAQYDPIVVEHFNRAHDRFLLIDDEVYHIGASLKDLGRKWFAFTLMHDITAAELICRISGSATVNIE
jgi:hypothetical protein